MGSGDTSLIQITLGTFQWHALWKQCWKCWLHKKRRYVLTSWPNIYFWRRAMSSGVR